MTQVPKTTKGQAVLQPEMVLCLNCNQAMQVVESNSTEGKNTSTLQMQCSQCNHAVKLHVKISSLGQRLSTPESRRKCLFALLSLVVLLLLGAAISFGQNLSSFGQHNPTHFQLGGPLDGKYTFEEAILYSDKQWGKNEGIEWEGVYSSSALSSLPVDVERVTGKALVVGLDVATVNGKAKVVRTDRARAKTIPDVRTITGSGTEIRRASPEQIPFHDALPPPAKPILDGMNLVSNPSNPGGIDRCIEPPPNTLVDLSSVNTAILSRQPGAWARGQVLNLGPGDYITNYLWNTTRLYSSGHNIAANAKSIAGTFVQGHSMDPTAVTCPGHTKTEVRIFVQDESSVTRGITFDNCLVGCPSGSIVLKGNRRHDFITAS